MLARRQRFRVLHGLTRGLRDGSIGILLRRRALLVDGSGSSRRTRLDAPAPRDLAGGRTDMNRGLCRRGSWRGRGQQPPEMRQQIGANRTSEAGGADLDELHEKAREVGNLARHRTPFRRNPWRIPTAGGGEFRALAARTSDEPAEKV